VPANVAAAVTRLGITWPVAIDSQMATWNAYQNEYWPAEYLLDRQGRVAYTSFGEGDYAQTDAAVAQLLNVHTRRCVVDAGSRQHHARAVRRAASGPSARRQRAIRRARSPQKYPDPGPPRARMTSR